MSAHDEVDFDDYEGLEDELAESFEGDPDELAPEDVFKMVMINRAKKVKVHVKLRDEDNDEVDLPETITQLLNYVKDQLKDGDGNQFCEQILPLMSQSVVSGLGRILGIQSTAFHLANEATRTGIIHMMAIGLLLLKFVQENNLTIHTFEEEVSDEEIEEIERKAKASSVATMSSAMGIDPKDVLRQLRDQGKITDEDLKDILGGDSDDTDEEGGANKDGN